MFRNFSLLGFFKIKSPLPEDRFSYPQRNVSVVSTPIEYLPARYPDRYKDLMAVHPMVRSSILRNWSPTQPGGVSTYVDSHYTINYRPF